MGGCLEKRSSKWGLLNALNFMGTQFPVGGRADTLKFLGTQFPLLVFHPEKLLHFSCMLNLYAEKDTMPDCAMMSL